MPGGARRHLGLVIGDVASERLQDQKELFSKHGLNTSLTKCIFELNNLLKRIDFGKFNH